MGKLTPENQRIKDATDALVERNYKIAGHWHRTQWANGISTAYRPVEGQTQPEQQPAQSRPLPDA
jgi:hypothetical protein